MRKTKSCGVIVVLALSAIVGTGIVLAQMTIEIQVAPATLNLYDVEDKCVTVHAEIPFTEVNSTDLQSLTLERSGGGVVSAYLAFWDSRGDLVVKFDREEVGNIVDEGDVTLKLTGYTTDGTEFTGTDTIRVINCGK